MRIVGRSRAIWSDVLERVLARSRSPHERFFRDMVPPMFVHARRYGFNWPGLVAMMLHETDAGHFTGKVKPEHCNPAGIKFQDEVRKIYPEMMSADLPLAHAIFPTWEVGTLAFVQHLAAWTDAELPSGEIVVDPRYPLVRRLVEANLTRVCVTFADLGGNWTPRPDYGDDIQRLALELNGGLP